MKFGIFEHYEKIKKKFKISVLAFVEGGRGYTDSNKKELSSFSTLGGDRLLFFQSQNRKNS